MYYHSKKKNMRQIDFDYIDNRSPVLGNDNFLSYYTNLLSNAVKNLQKQQVEKSALCTLYLNAQSTFFNLVVLYARSVKYSTFRHGCGR